MLPGFGDPVEIEANGVAQGRRMQGYRRRDAGPVGVFFTIVLADVNDLPSWF